MLSPILCSPRWTRNPCLKALKSKLAFSMLIKYPALQCHTGGGSWPPWNRHDSGGICSHLKHYLVRTIPIIAHDTDPMDAAQLARLHDEFKHIYPNHVNVEKTLKRIILEAYDNMYTSQLEDYLLKNVSWSPLEILVPLSFTYAFISHTKLADNCNKMTAPTSFQDPIETLFTQIEYGVWYANAIMQPYTYAYYVNISFLLVPNTGVVPYACKA
jgi:hypothetical protein